MEVIGQMGSNIINYVSLCSMVTNLVRRSLITMMTFLEVRGQQRSNVVMFLYGYHIWSYIPLIQATRDDDDLMKVKGHQKVMKGQTVLKSSLALKLCQKNH